MTSPSPDDGYPGAGCCFLVRNRGSEKSLPRICSSKGTVHVWKDPSRIIIALLFLVSLFIVITLIAI